MLQIRVAALVAAVSLGTSGAWAQTACPVQSAGQCSALIGSTPVQLTSSNARRYQRIVNNSTTDTLSCTRDPKVTPSVNGVGTYSIGPGQFEEYSLTSTGYVPPAPTVCVSTGTTTPVAVETN